MPSDSPVIVVGGGVIGLCIAHYLTSAGVPVEVTERASLGSGASWGNAGWVCLSHSAPVPAPGVTHYALRSLGKPESPLYLRPPLDPRFLVWLWRLWRNSNESAFRHGYAAVAALNRPTFDLFEGLAEAGVDTTLQRPGLVHAFLSASQARHHLDVQGEMADGHYHLPEQVTVGPDAHRLDPALSAEVQAAYLVRGEGVVDPVRLVTSLAQVVKNAGGHIRENVTVTGFRTVNGKVTAVRTAEGDLPCRAVVVAAGMWSQSLMAQLGVQLSMQAGKGYSFSVDLDPAPSHALYLGDRRVVASPMNGTTRIAGTMELSGNNRKLDWRRIVAIARASRHYLGRWFDDPDDLPRRIRDPWVGGRPFLADGLPMIDRTPSHDNVFVATGHGMLGVTLGPATGQALADYFLTGHRPDVLNAFQLR
ncbi:D-amino-acid dehydrogenase [Kibdelosporangium banguiense]|uniref:D-amino-acid dehydrogenase n=1 Tax=Kibdelosporangium banguiense TaxID=1365924 RepID=A0ABS4TFC3_9PSEU|nr:FAD-dependent oxidoreductase [Kibdelosporangium banguiense]MBP2323098.1 D-amino-acid dehydrogenase [Kibdelosporangium banguiense]